jgi:hypothetical protein
MLPLQMLYFEDLSVGMTEKPCGHGKTFADKAVANSDKRY